MAQAVKVLLVLILLVMAWWPTPTRTAYTTYYVSKSGSDANTCTQAQSAGTPKLTIAAGLGCLTDEGDTLLIGNGTYVEIVSTASIPGTGTPGAHITIKAENRRQVIVAPGGASTRALTIIDPYITIEGIVFNCTSTAGGDNTACLSNNVTPGTNGVWLIDNEFYNSQGGGMLVGGGASSWVIELNTVRDNGWATDYHNSNGLYLPSIQQSLIRRNELYHNECNAIRLGNSTSGTVEATDNIVEYNYIHDNGDGFGGVEDCGSDGAGIMLGGQRNTARYNIITNQYRTGIWFYSLSANVETDNTAYNNTIYNVSYYGIAARANVFNSIAKNNHIVGAGLAATFDQGTGTVFSNNRTTGVLTDCTVSTSDFTQKAGSLCNNAGVDVGLPANGVPDIGATEQFVFESCEVPFSAPNTIQVTFTSNANLLGNTLTTFTARRNGSNNALTGAASKIGDTIISLPMTTTYGAGDTVDISWASGGLTDNARIGGTINQPFRQTLTNQSCTNNAGGAPAYSLSQVRYQYRGVYGPENTTDIRSVENVASYETVVNGGLRLRLAVTNAVQNAPSLALLLRYAKNGGTHTVIPASFNADGIAMCGSRYPSPGVVSGASTTNQLSTSGTFIPGAVVFEAFAIPTITGLNVGYKTEAEYCVTWNDTASGTFTFYLYEQSGVALASYSAVPSVVIVSPRGGGMP